VGKLLAAAGTLAFVGLAAGCSSSATLVDHTAGGAVAHVGDTLDLKTAAGNPFQMTLTQVTTDAHATSGSAGKNKRFIAVMFQVTDTASQAIAGDSNADANLLAADGQAYLPDHTQLRECGSTTTQYHVAPGKTSHSCVAFRVRTSVKITQVQFFPAAGSASDYGQWLVP